MLELFARYDWPGNIRELENVLEHGYACTPGQVITTDGLPAFFQHPEPPADGRRPDPPPADGNRDERQRVLDALRQSGWKILPAARELGVDRTTLWRKMKKLGLGGPQKGH